MRFPNLARVTAALGLASGPVYLAGTVLALAAGASSILNRLLNGKAAHCPDCEGPLVPGKCPEGPCLVCPKCGEGCFDEQARRTIVAVQELATARPAKAGDPCTYCRAELVEGSDAETGAPGLVCLDCDAGEEPEEEQDETPTPTPSPTTAEPVQDLEQLAPLAISTHTDAPAGSPAPAEDLAKASADKND